MNAKTETSTTGGSSAFDTIKLLIAVAVLVGGIWLFHQYEGQWPTYARVLEMAGAVVLAGLVMSQTALGRLFLAFSFKSRDELRKVVWPTRQETMQSTLVILVVVLIVGIMLWIIDSIIGALMRWILG
jgi:preprotein translocase subunit SecE